MSNSVLAQGQRTTFKNLTVIGTERCTGIANFESGVRGPSTVITAALGTARTLLADESGSLILLGQASANQTVITLPAPASGLTYKFMLTATTDATNRWQIAFPTAVGKGMLGAIPGAPVYVNGTGIITLTQSATAANSKPGDFIEVYSDGTSWFYNGLSGGAAASWVAA